MARAGEGRLNLPERAAPGNRNAICRLSIRPTAPAVRPTTEPAPPVGLLTFQDPTGDAWRVWRVDTPAAQAHLVEASFRNGWLVFEREDGSERRRLAQAPDDWESLSAHQLFRLSEVASRVESPRPGSADPPAAGVPLRDGTGGPGA